MCKQDCPASLTRKQGAGHNTHGGHVMSLSIVAAMLLLVLYTEEFVQ